MDRTAAAPRCSGGRGRGAARVRDYLPRDGTANELPLSENRPFPSFSLFAKAPGKKVLFVRWRLWDRNAGNRCGPAVARGDQWREQFRRVASLPASFPRCAAEGSTPPVCVGARRPFGPPPRSPGGVWERWLRGRGGRNGNGWAISRHRCPLPRPLRAPRAPGARILIGCAVQSRVAIFTYLHQLASSEIPELDRLRRRPRGGPAPIPGDGARRGVVETPAAPRGGPPAAKSPGGNAIPRPQPGDLAHAAGSDLQK